MADDRHIVMILKCGCEWDLAEPMLSHRREFGQGHGSGGRPLRGKGAQVFCDDHPKNFGNRILKEVIRDGPPDTAKGPRLPRLRDLPERG